MNVLLQAIGLFFAALLLHLIIWRIRLPGNHAAALLLIFSAVFISGIFIFRSNTACEYLQLSLLFFSSAAAYVANYPAIEADSPTIVMVKAIADRGRDGLDKGVFYDKMNNDVLVKPRIDDLLRGGFVSLDKGKYKLTATGLVVAAVFKLSRRVLGLGRLGG